MHGTHIKMKKIMASVDFGRPHKKHCSNNNRVPVRFSNRVCAGRCDEASHLFLLSLVRSFSGTSVTLLLTLLHLIDLSIASRYVLPFYYNG